MIPTLSVTADWQSASQIKLAHRFSMCPMCSWSSVSMYAQQNRWIRSWKAIVTADMKCVDKTFPVTTTEQEWMVHLPAQCVWVSSRLRGLMPVWCPCSQMVFARLATKFNFVARIISALLTVVVGVLPWVLDHAERQTAKRNWGKCASQIPPAMIRQTWMKSIYFHVKLPTSHPVLVGSVLSTQEV